MKKFVLSAVALAATASPGFAADLVQKAPAAPVAVAAPPAWDVAFGGVIMTDYNFRGISQSNNGPSAGAYFEPQFNTPVGTVYVGLAGYAIEWPSSPDYAFTDPSAEIDIYGGWRNSWGAFSLDLGAIYYHYPSEQFNGATTDSDFYEFYAKASYAVTPAFTLGGNIFYTPDLLNYSESFATFGVDADASAFYVSGTAKWITPWSWGDLGTYVSGELGYWSIDDSGFVDPAFGLVDPTDPSYAYYNIGVAFTYKAVTLDLRYHGSDQDARDCRTFLLTLPGNRANTWCDDTVIASLKFDTTLNSLK